MLLHFDLGALCRGLVFPHSNHHKEKRECSRGGEHSILLVGDGCVGQQSVVGTKKLHDNRLVMTLWYPTSTTRSNLEEPLNVESIAGAAKAFCMKMTHDS